MGIYRYENLSQDELSALPRGKTAVLLPVSPMEQHGPHLPLGVDAIFAGFFSEEIARRLSEKKPDWNFILFPTLVAGSDTLIHDGTVEVRPSILRGLVYDCSKALAKNGFDKIIAVSGHGGPRHLVVLEEVSAKMRWRHRARMISASSRLLFQVLKGGFTDRVAALLEKDGGRLSDEERAGLKGDYHGGFLETSVMMVARPDLVKPHFKELRPAIVDKIWKVTRKSGKTAGDGLGYLGSPALARPEVGRAILQAVFDESLPIFEKFLDGEDVRKAFRSPFYYIPILRTDFKWLLALFLYAGALGAAWLVFIGLLEAYK